MITFNKQKIPVEVQYIYFTSIQLKNILKILNELTVHLYPVNLFISPVLSSA